MDVRLAFQLVFLIILFCISGTRAKCRRGEPINDRSDTAPDLNITLSPGSDLRVGDRLNVTCTADKPRYQFPKTRILRPVYIGIFLGSTLLTSQKYEGKQDQERVELIHTINLTMAENNVMVACQTRNSDSTCRVKILRVNVADRAMHKSVSFTTSMPTSTNQTLPSASSTTNVTSLTIQSREISSSSSEMMSSQMPSIQTNFTMFPSREISSSSSEMMSSQMPSIQTNFTMFASPTTTFKLKSTSTAINNGGDGGKQGGKKDEDDDEVEDVKNLIIATLILVGITLLLVFVTIIYVIRKVSE